VLELLEHSAVQPANRAQEQRARNAVNTVIVLMLRQWVVLRGNLQLATCNCLAEMAHWRSTSTA
jgi:hypothetical protein